MPSYKLGYGLSITATIWLLGASIGLLFLYLYSLPFGLFYPVFVPALWLIYLVPGLASIILHIMALVSFCYLDPITANWVGADAREEFAIASFFLFYSVPILCRLVLFLRLPRSGVALLFLSMTGIFISMSFADIVPIYFLAAWVRILWPLWYSCNYAARYLELPLLTQLTPLPFWNYGLYTVPVPASPLILRSYQVNTPSDLSTSIRSGALTILSACVVMIVLRGLFSLLFARNYEFLPGIGPLHQLIGFEPFRFPNIDDGYGQMRQFSYSSIWVILANVIRLAMYLMEIFVSFGVAVGIARVAGFRLPQFINEPHKSNSVGQFAARTIYYYQWLCNEIFIRPLNKYFFRMRLGAWSLPLAIWVGVSSFGVLFHVFRDSPKIIEEGRDLWSILLQLLIYFSLISLVFILSHKYKLKGPRAYKIIISFIFLFFAILAIAGINRMNSDLAEYSKTLLFIFERL